MSTITITIDDFTDQRRKAFNYDDTGVLLTNFFAVVNQHVTPGHEISYITQYELMNALFIHSTSFTIDNVDEGYTKSNLFTDFDVLVNQHSATRTQQELATKKDELKQLAQNEFDRRVQLELNIDPSKDMKNIQDTIAGKAINILSNAQSATISEIRQLKLDLINHFSNLVLTPLSQENIDLQNESMTENSDKQALKSDLIQIISQIETFTDLNVANDYNVKDDTHWPE